MEFAHFYFDKDFRIKNELYIFIWLRIFAGLLVLDFKVYTQHKCLITEIRQSEVYDEKHKNNFIMKTSENTVKEILANVPREMAEPFNKLHNIIVKNLPKGFEAAISYGGLGYVVPHSIYPPGYHCKPSEPLPFAGIASRKNSINFYHMGLYTDPELMKWFVAEYPKHCAQKLEMGKSCVRFKNLDDIPYKLIADLMKKLSAKKWIEMYEKNYVSKSK